MSATVELPEAVLRQVEGLALRHGVTAAELIRLLVDEHNASQPVLPGSFEVQLPLIPASETGPIRSVEGEDVDEMLLR